MKIAHFSDTHLGYGRYERTNKHGVNQRMADVVETFRRVLEDIVASEAEIVIHAGDFFDCIRPPNLVITTAYKELMRFQKRREGMPLIIIAGNHDSPKSVGVGNILSIFGSHEQTECSIPGVYVVESSPRHIVLPDLKFEALAMPWGGEAEPSQVKPENPRFTSALIAHGLEQTLGISGASLSLSRMNRERWNYVALGDYHIRKHLVDNVWYCGSTDYTSTNFWDEIEPKGWLLFDTEGGPPGVRNVDPVRSALSMPTIDATGLSGTEIADMLLKSATWDVTPEGGPMVRQVVTGCDPLARAEVPGDVRNELNSRALIYDLKMYLASRSPAGDTTAPHRGATLREDWQSFAEKRDLPISVSREEFVTAGHKMLEEAVGDPEEN